MKRCNPFDRLHPSRGHAFSSYVCPDQPHMKLGSPRTNLMYWPMTIKCEYFQRVILRTKKTGIFRVTLRLHNCNEELPCIHKSSHLQFSAGLNSKRSSFGSSNLGRKMTEEVVEMNRIRVESLVLEVTNPVVCQYTMVDMTFTYSWFFCST